VAVDDIHNVTVLGLRHLGSQFPTMTANSNVRGNASCGKRI
jgi:hypothetical protein